MLPKNYYPTPGNAIQILLDGLDLNIHHNILEPSAGTGHMLYSLPPKKIDCIEIDEDLQAILKKHEKCNLIANDFYSFHPDKNYDFIIMNPPFDEGDKHLLHAWNIAENTTIRCILNAETILNPFSQTRKTLLNIINEYGYYTIHDNLFTDSERKTNVQVAIIHLQKTTKTNYHDFTLEKDDDISFEEKQNQTLIDSKKQLENLCTEYRMAHELFQEGISKIFEAQNMIKYFSQYTIPEIRHTSNKRDLIESFRTKAKEDAWRYIVDKTKIKKYCTSKTLNSIHEKEKELGSLALNMTNIESIISSLFYNRKQIMQESLVQCFDTLTSYNKDNIYEVKTFKHNSGHLINKKIILPGVTSMCRYSNKLEKILYGRPYDLLNDLDKTLSYISGKDFSNIKTIVGIINNNLHEEIQEGECEYFKYKLFKNGNLHLTFLSEDVWATFNKEACEGKGWIPKEETGWKQSNKF